jgi:hypothetical protein
MAKELTKEEAQERAQLRYIHEANCKIEHPTEQEKAFRWATMKLIAQLFDYSRVKGVELTINPTRSGRP